MAAKVGGIIALTTVTVSVAAVTCAVCGGLLAVASVSYMLKSTPVDKRLSELDSKLEHIDEELKKEEGLREQVERREALNRNVESNVDNPRLSLYKLVKPDINQADLRASRAKSLVLRRQKFEGLAERYCLEPEVNGAAFYQFLHDEFPNVSLEDELHIPTSQFPQELLGQESLVEEREFLEACRFSEDDISNCLNTLSFLKKLELYYPEFHFEDCFKYLKEEFPGNDSVYFSDFTTSLANYLKNDPEIFTFLSVQDFQSVFTNLFNFDAESAVFNGSFFMTTNPEYFFEPDSDESFKMTYSFSKAKWMVDGRDPNPCPFSLTFTFDHCLKKMTACDVQVGGAESEMKQYVAGKFAFTDLVGLANDYIETRCDASDFISQLASDVVRIPNNIKLVKNDST